MKDIEKRIEKLEDKLNPKQKPRYVIADFEADPLFDPSLMPAGFSVPERYRCLGYTAEMFWNRTQVEKMEEAVKRRGISEDAYRAEVVEQIRIKKAEKFVGS